MFFIFSVHQAVHTLSINGSQHTLVLPGRCKRCHTPLVLPTWFVAISLSYILFLVLFLSLIVAVMLFDFQTFSPVTFDFLKVGVVGGFTTVWNKIKRCIGYGCNYNADWSRGVQYQSGITTLSDVIQSRSCLRNFGREDKTKPVLSQKHQ
jgi:hypothetical protein